MDRTVIYYFSATGNSLYTARQLRDAIDGVVLRSMPEELRNDEIIADAERVGFVFPMHYFGRIKGALYFCNRHLWRSFHGDSVYRAEQDIGSSGQKA